MKITIEIDDTTSAAEIADCFEKIANNFSRKPIGSQMIAPDLNAEEEETAPVATAPKKRGRPAKTQTAAPVESGNESVIEDEEEKSIIETSALKAESPKASAKKYTLENVIDAFRVYAQKTSRENAIKILGRFNAKSVRDLPETSYTDVMRSLA